ncbi:hypothetical protein SUGI_0487030 [Cryptomeria japonica]|uniref:UDP-glycosyltransferase 74E1 n=1 Tax=Cryptomeria japonica TaxID=3369 RepID=UPI002408AF8B|nr:UDP-glycosyltransferase 74E1 [Cryptomeria japonica]GLJ25432.1 hypothetical protein SUGI_0487030 [Cryptomeria japonica]
MGSLGDLENSIKRTPGPHVVVFPYPAQGHINPLVEFAKRLVSHNLMVTFITTEKVKERMAQAQNGASCGNSALQNIRIETISDGVTPDLDRKKSSDTEIDLLKKFGSVSFEHLIERLNAQGQRVSCIVYDSFLEWVPLIAKKFVIPVAFFWTQSCAVYSIYYHCNKRTVNEEDILENGMNVKGISGLPQLHPSDIPSFLQASNPNPYMLKLVLDQFNLISQAKWILGNSFTELEAEEIKSMDSLIQIRTVGPLVPSYFLQGNNPKDTDVGANLWKATDCMNWLKTKGESTVIYVSFGSLAILSKEQIHEIAFGLKASGHSFLWVIRPGDNKEENSTTQDLPEGFLEETSGKGLVVPWCPQMRVLSHSSIALFMTHCGWNSTLESICSGVPMLAFPQWSDQPTNAKYIEEHWKMGIRLKKKEDGLVGREEMHKSIKEVMETKRGVELRKNSLRWKTLAMKSMENGGSSQKNIEAFIEEVINSASLMPYSTI